MNRHIWTAALGAVALTACIDESPVAPPASRAAFSVTASGTDLGAMWGPGDTVGHNSRAEGINDFGIIVGRNYHEPSHALEWSADGVLRDVHAAPYNTSLAKAVNEHGMTTGHALFAGGWRAYRQAPGDQMEELGALPGGVDSFGEDINPAGVVAGYAYTSVNGSQLQRAVRAAPGSALEDLGLPAGWPENAQSGGYGINDAGTVVGWAVGCSGCSDTRAVRARVGGAMEILNVPTRSEAVDINNRDQVVGNYRSDSLPVYRVFMLGADGTARRLPVPEDAPGNAWVHGLNDRGDAVGEVWWSDGVTHAVVWPAGGGIIDLGPGAARAINDVRVVVGSYTAPDGHEHAMRWTVPGLTLPMAASGVQARGAGSGKVNVFWADNSDNEDRFRVRRALRNPDGTFGAYRIIGNRGPNNQVLLDSTVVIGETYRYQVQTCSAAGCTYSAPSSAITVVPLPAAPSGLRALTSGIETVNLSWTDNGANESTYRVRRATRDSAGVFGAYVTLRLIGADATGDTDATVKAGHTYRYQVQACNGGGCASSSAVVISIPPRPAAPLSLSGSVVSATQINLSWGDASSNETSFRLRRSKRNADGTWGSYQLVETLGSNTTSHQDLTVSPSSTYRYYVQACNAGGCASSTITQPLNVPAAP